MRVTWLYSQNKYIRVRNPALSLDRYINFTGDDITQTSARQEISPPSPPPPPPLLMEHEDPSRVHWAVS